MFLTLSGDILVPTYGNGVVLVRPGSDGWAAVWRSGQESCKASPLVTNEAFVEVSLDGLIACFDVVSKSLPSLRWRSTVSVPIFAEPVLHKDFVIVMTVTGVLVTLEVKSGRTSQILGW